MSIASRRRKKKAQKKKSKPQHPPEHIADHIARAIGGDRAGRRARVAGTSAYFEVDCEKAVIYFKIAHYGLDVITATIPLCDPKSLTPQVLKDAACDGMNKILTAKLKHHEGQAHKHEDQAHKLREAIGQDSMKGLREKIKAII